MHTEDKGSDLTVEENLHIKVNNYEVGADLNLSAEEVSFPTQDLNSGTETIKIRPDLPQFDVLPSEIKTKMWGFISTNAFVVKYIKCITKLLIFEETFLPSQALGTGWV